MVCLNAVGMWRTFSQVNFTFTAHFDSHAVFAWHIFRTMNPQWSSPYTGGNKKIRYLMNRELYELCDTPVALPFLSQLWCYKLLHSPKTWVVNTVLWLNDGSCSTEIYTHVVHHGSHGSHHVGNDIFFLYWIMQHTIIITLQDKH
jgi:hypothetical protein